MNEASRTERVPHEEAGTATHQQSAARAVTVILQALAFEPTDAETEMLVAGPIRAAFAAYWEGTWDEPLPLTFVRAVMTNPVERDRLTQGHLPTDDAQLLTELFDRLAQAVVRQRVAWKAYTAQIRQSSCPGCGEGDCVF